MKPANVLVLLFFLVMMFFSCMPVKKEGIAVLRAKIDSTFLETPDFSGVVLVADRGKVVFHKAFGMRDFELQTPLGTGDIFELASVSKQFTAMIIMQLEEQGLLAFDDSLSTFIPGLPYAGITVRHLLNHTSGLPDYQSVMDQHWDKTAIAGNEDNIAYLIRYHPPRLFLPRERYEYSNTGYMLLASIAERTSGEDFISLCRKLIFSPLNLRDTDIRTNEQKREIPNFARGYIFVPGKEKYVRADSFPEFNYTIWLGDRKGPGRISSTSSDLLKWDRALYSPSLVKQSTLQKAFTPATLLDGSLSNYGFGWTLGSDDRLGKVVWHTGDNPGYKTEIVRYIDADKTIILLNNNAHQRKAEIMSALKHIVSHHAWQEE